MGRNERVVEDRDDTDFRIVEIDGELFSEGEPSTASEPDEYAADDAPEPEYEDGSVATEYPPVPDGEEV